MRSLFLLPLLFLLPACQTIMNPSFMPAGYKYNNSSQEFKAPPGPEADNIGYDYSYDQNQEVLQKWRIIISDLVDQMEQEAGVVAQPVFVKPLRGQNAFNATYDHVLREELRDRGYELKSKAKSNLEIQYEGYLEGEKFKPNVESRTAHHNVVNEQPAPLIEKPKEFHLVLTVIVHGTPVKVVKTLNNVPGFGYKPGAGRQPEKLVPQELKHQEDPRT